MSGRNTIIQAALAVGLFAGQAATAEWLHYANGVSQASLAKQDHAGSLTVWEVVSTTVKQPTVCAAYESNHPTANRGRIVSRARIDRADGSIEILDFRGRVRNNLSLECQAAAGPIGANDLVTFDFTFKAFPKQKMGGGRSDFYSVNGIVSSIAQLGPRLIPPGVNPPSSGGRLQAAISMFAAERDRHRHPKSLTQTVVVANNATLPVICSALGSVSEKANKGRVLTSVTIRHQNGSQTTLGFNGKVVDNIYSECRLGPSLVAGDEVVFEYTFKRIPKLRIDAGFFEAVATYGVVSPDGIPTLRATR